MKKQKKTIWNQLTELAEQQKQQSILSLFDDTERAKKYSFQFEDFYIDFSKQNLSDDAFEVLLSLAEVSEIKDKIQQLFDGGIVNKTECRSALHHLLRQPIDETSDCEISNHHLELLKEIEQSKVKIETIVKQLHDRQWLGSTGKSITDVIAIGVGGSDLGPYMVTDALSEFTHPKAKDINVHFVSNMDGTQLDRLIQSLNPETTLVIISSKSFTTSDTLYNAETARNWMTAGAQNKADIFARHFIGISTNASKMTEWGIAQENQIPMWEWVGGRYSFWSAIGLPIAIKIGFEAFKDLLAGAHAIDIHFSTTELKENIPFLTGLIAVWNATFLNINAHSVLPYDGRLKLLPNYLTQLEMESNGKRVDNQGNQIDYKTCPILWGDVGTNAQHAFYQLLHQGTESVSCDFIACINRYDDADISLKNNLAQQHKLSLANCLGQSRVLAFGNNAIDANQQTPAHKIYRGNQPSTTILMNALTPYNLGSLIALYEHKVYTMACLWDINPFDQWGVELGKVMSGQMLEVLEGVREGEFDSSTKNLINQIKK